MTGDFRFRQATAAEERFIFSVPASFWSEANFENWYDLPIVPESAGASYVGVFYTGTVSFARQLGLRLFKHPDHEFIWLLSEQDYALVCEFGKAVAV